MQAPERLALIGGSILLASTLIFTLKSQASSIVPRIGRSISTIYGHINDTPAEIDFQNGLQRAQKNGRPVGKWGTSQYYIDQDNNMYISGGTLQGTLTDAIGAANTNSLKTVNLTAATQAPQDSSFLLSGVNSPFAPDNDSIEAVHGLDHLDTRQVTNMSNMLAKNNALKSIEGIRDWDTGHMKNAHSMFADDASLSSIDLSGWQTAQANDLGYMFSSDSGLQSLDLRGLDTTNASTDGLFIYTSGRLSNLNLGDKTYLKDHINMSDGTWHNSGQSLNSQQILDGNIHPGDWTKE